MKVIGNPIKLIFLLILIQTQLNQITAQCHIDDWTALKALYESTDGDNWTNNSGWSQVTGTAPPANCNLGGMHRVVLNTNGRVDKLLLFTNNLVGNIPAELSSLSSLTDLTLQSNDLGGAIPSELENLSNLIKLNLSSNELTGNIPPELGNLSNLEIMQLSLNQLSGVIPSEFKDLDNVINLNLRSNQLTGTIPPELGNMDNLQILSLSNNQLSGTIPVELGDLNNLTNMSLYNNQLTGSIPAELGNLSSIDLLWLYGNQLTGMIPPELGDLSTLTKLRLSNNLFVGDIPSVIGNLNNLTELYLYSNQLTGNIPPEFGDLSSLLDLRIYSNQLSGCYDSNLSTLCTQLNEIKNSYISNANNFDADWEDFCASGAGACCASTQDYNPLMALYYITDGANWTINSGWGQDCDICNWHGILCDANGRVNSIVLNNNNLNGTLPTELQTLDELKTLIISNNSNLVGEIPNELGTLLNLEYMDLSYNGLTGLIPMSLGDLINLTDLNLNNNYLVGIIPNELTQLINLINLRLGNNDYDEGIPIDIGDLENLEILSIANSGLTGTIPDGIGDLSNLKILSLGYNSLEGNIPESMINLCSIITLQLNNNMLEGPVLEGLGSLPELQSLALSTNNLTGCIPDNLCNLNTVFLFNNVCLPLSGGTVGSTYICDPAGGLCDIPAGCAGGPGQNGPSSGICTCPTPQDIEALMSLYNATGGLNWTIQWDLSQPIDTWHGITLNQDGCIVSIVLVDNGLVGTIPAELGNLALLTILNLDNNQLDGSIPSELGNLTNLTLLNLSRNNLTGFIPMELGNLTNLEILSLYLNDLVGTIPPELGELSYLTELWLNYNMLSGSIPPEFGNLYYLSILRLHHNSLDGNIPASLGDLRNLKELRLNDNQLIGSIPSEIGDLTSLTHFLAAGNQLSGNIPLEIGELSNLIYLSLDNNQLTGSIPYSIDNLTQLEYLGLSKNQLVGNMPLGIGNLTNLAGIFLSDNQLSGCYAPELFQLCDRLAAFYSSDFAISDENNFDLDWEDFCDGAVSDCLDPCIPILYIDTNPNTDFIYNACEIAITDISFNTNITITAGQEINLNPGFLTTNQIELCLYIQESVCQSDDVDFMNVSTTNNSCPICTDGEICVEAPGANRLSFDGGNTWLSFDPAVVNCYEGFSDGTYDIVAMSPTTCNRSQTVVFQNALGQQQGECNNGGFENGNFDNWTGGLGTNNPVAGAFGPYDIFNTDFDNGERHRIINTDDFVDGFFPEVLNGNNPGLGQYIARLGNPRIRVGASRADCSSDLERLTFCFTVDAQNQDFNFRYAQVLQDPADHEQQEGHAPDELPFLKYQIFRSLDASVIAENTTLSNDPYLETGADDIKLRGWTCVNSDLSAYIGEEICVEFINGDCSRWAHWGYSYIDALCTPSANLAPTSAFTACSDVACGDQSFDLIGTAGNYSDFQWTIAKVDGSGNEFDILQLPPEIGQIAELVDIKSIYETNSNFTVDCPQVLKATFTVFNGCGSASSSQEFNFECSNFTIDYCKPIVFCGAPNTNQVLVTGINDCNNCTYSWTSNGDNGIAIGTETAKFPTIDRFLWPDAFENTYYVEVTTPEGCVIKDSIYIIDANGINIDLDIDTCSVKLSVDFIHRGADPPEINVINTVDGYVANLKVDENLSNGSHKFYSVILGRALGLDLILDVSSIFETSDLCAAGNCSDQIPLGPISASLSYIPFCVFWPNTIAPWANPPNNRFRPFIAGCTGYSPPYFISLAIFDRWGNKVHDVNTDNMIIPANGFTGV